MNLVCEKYIWQILEKYFFFKVVDGLCGNILESGGQWLVDFGIIQSIYKIVIYYRIDEMLFGEWIKNYFEIVEKLNK